MRAKCDLMRYLKINSRNEIELIDLIKRFNLNRIFIDTLKLYDEKEYVKAKITVVYQKEFNKKVLDELLILTNSFEKNSIKLVHIKGLSLANDIYDCPEERLFGDIDLLISIKDLRNSLDILGDEGYLSSYDNRSMSRFAVDSNLYEHLRIHSHIPTISKKHSFSIFSKLVNFPVDLHTRLFNNPIHQWIYMENILNRCVLQNICNNLNIWVLELHDRIIYLFYHFTKEYIVDLLLSGNAIPRITLLYDIALVIDKYSNQIDWNIIFDRIEEWNLGIRIFFAIRLFEKIFPGRIPITKNVLLHFNPDQVIFSNAYNIVNDMLITICSGSNLEIPLKVNNNTSSEIQFIIKGTNVYNIHEDKHYIYNGATGNIYWNELNLHIYIRVIDNEIHDILEEHKELDNITIALGLCDSKELLCTMRNIHFVPKMKDDITLEVYGMCDDFHTGDHIYKYGYKTNIYDDGFSLYIEMPWKIIGIKPYIGRKILFDLIIKYHNSFGKHCREKIAWASTYDPIWQPEYMGTIELKG